jgi:hypothetical protein
LRNTCGRKTEEVTKDWRNPNNEEVHNLYSSQNTAKIMKSRRLRYGVKEACKGEKRNAFRRENQKERDHWVP